MENNDNFTPYKNLASAVILDSLKNLKSHNKQRRESSLHFLTTDSEILNLWCEVAGLDRDGLKRAVLKYKKQGKIK